MIFANSEKSPWTIRVHFGIKRLTSTNYCFFYNFQFIYNLCTLLSIYFYQFIHISLLSLGYSLQHIQNWTLLRHNRLFKKIGHKSVREIKFKKVYHPKCKLTWIGRQKKSQYVHNSNRIFCFSIKLWIMSLSTTLINIRLTEPFVPFTTISWQSRKTAYLLFYRFCRLARLSPTYIFKLFFNA